MSQTIPKVPDVLTEFYEQSPHAILFINEERRVVGMNPAAELLTGFVANEVAGEARCAQLFRCHDTDGNALCAGAELFGCGLPHKCARYQLRRKDGKDVSVVADYALLTTHDHQRVAQITMKPVAVLEADWLAKRRRCKGWARALVTALLAAALVLTVVTAAMAWGKQRSAAWVTAGRWEQLRVGTPTLLLTAYPKRAANAALSPAVFYGVLRVGEPIVVVSGTCPLDGATVRWDARGRQFVCPQDGSAFSAEGIVVDGPATKPLSKPEWKWEGKRLLVRLPRKRGN